MGSRIFLFILFVNGLLREGRGCPQRKKDRFFLFNSYPNIDISVLCISSRSEISQYLTGFLKYLPRNMALLVQKLLRKKICQNPRPTILRQKKKEGG